MTNDGIAPSIDWGHSALEEIYELKRVVQLIDQRLRIVEIKVDALVDGDGMWARGITKAINETVAFTEKVNRRLCKLIERLGTVILDDPDDG